tara:strand:+ start:898 stop:1431 length:534 start_codon:yes stop_codon:yes gene_type:complete
MQNQKYKNIGFINISQFRSILSLYLFTIGTSLLGFSTYLLLETFGFGSNNMTSWSGQSLFWGLILFLGSLFILFFPIEFLNFFWLVNKTFTELISNILFTILISLLFLVFFQIFIPDSSKLLLEVGDLFKASSFAGFIVVPISLFILNYFCIRSKLVENYGFSLVLFVWIFGTLIFI